jgi:hypothetical protein
VTLSRFEIYGEKKEATVHELLGKKVACIKVESDDALQMIFDNGGAVRIIRDPKLEESCSIYIDGETYVIS